jgi:hypothetical protein
MSMELFKVGVKGEVKIEDDLGTVLLEKENAIHPQNMSRIIARALAHEDNSWVYKIALGRGGTYIDATGDISFKRPNDGYSPDVAGWKSRLYDETYSEIVDERAGALLGSGPGANIGGDPAGVSGVRSITLPTGDAQVIVTFVLNAGEPNTQQQVSTNASAVNAFIFNELGLFTPGLPLTRTQGYMDVILGHTGKVYTDNTNLAGNTSYTFSAYVDGSDAGHLKNFAYTTPRTGTGAYGKITYGDLVGGLNTYFAANSMGIIAQITQPGINTFGALRFVSTAITGTSTVSIVDPVGAYPSNWLFSNLKSDAGVKVWSNFGQSVPGRPAGDEDNSADQTREAERMLTHLIFSPLQKDATRTWKITYKLTVVVLQSESA